jgi:translocation and assembly module TamB
MESARGNTSSRWDRHFNGVTVNWKRLILWIVLAVVVLLAAVITTGVLLLKYNHGFRGYLLAKVERSVYDSTGAQLQVRDFNVSLSTLSMDIYGLVVHGTEPEGEPPLFTADHLNADINVDSVFGKKWHFQNITLDHPVAHLAVNKAGENNLPKSKKPSSNSSTNLFDLGIRRLLLDHGAVYYNDRKTPLNADLHDLELTAGYDPMQRRYMGHMSYDDGHVQYGSYVPLPHNLDAAFNLTPDRFTLDRLALSIGESRAMLNGTVEDYSNNAKVQANYDASLVTSEFAKVLNNPSLPAGTVRLTGFLKYQQQPNRPFLETASIYGMVSSPELYVKTPSLHTSVRDLSAKYKLENGNADVQNLHAQVLDGRLDGKLTVRDLTGAGQGRLQASLKSVSLDLLQKAAKTNSLREAHLVGNVSADAQASWAKNLKNLVAHSDVTIDASVGQNPSTPLNGVVHADYLAAGQQIALHQSYIRTPQTSITLDGKISQLSQLQIRMHSNDLHEVESLAANFKTASASNNGAPQQMDLHGTATLNATVSGSLNNPNIKGQLTANNLRVKGSSWKLLQTNISANPSQVTLSNGELQSATQGRFSFNLQSRLNHWAYSPSNPIAVNLSGSAISIADLAHLANKDYPVSGTLSLNVSIHGTQENPVGNGRITLANAKVSDEPIHSINVNFQGDGRALNANLAIHMPAGTTEAQGTFYPKSNSYQTQVRANNLRLDRLQTIKALNVPVNGAVTLNVTGRGTLKNPELLATIDIPRLQVQKQTIQGIKFQTHLQNHVADIALDSSVAQTYVKARGSVGTQAPYMANVRLDTGRVTFAPILAIYAPAQANDLTGETELHASLQGPLQHKDRLEAHIQVPVLNASYKQQLQLAAARPIRLDYQNSVAVLQPTSIQGTDTDIRLQANVPIKNLKAASFLVQGTVDLRIAQAIEPTLQSTGQIQFDIDSRRYTAGNLNGQVRIVNATVHTADSPVGLDHANGVISVTKDRVEITSFQGAVGGGTITAQGGVAYSPKVEFNLAMAARQIRIRYPEGLRTVVNSDLSMTGSTQAALVSGQVLIQHISFTPDFDLSSFMGQFGDGETAAPSSGFTQNVKLNVAVQSTSQMQLQSSLVA